ncbi:MULTISPECIES: cytochrome c551 [unclassified Lysinibacillus]|uniref:cytochrome c551 n=1 Tax=unclassified Lysinibacillus TaxID=2636778 RepID=UPI0035E34E68
MKKAMLTLAIGSAIFLAACGGGKTATNEGTKTTTPNGETIAMKSCISCHGGELQGQGNAPKISDIGSRLTEAEILDVIKNGKNGMPPNVVKGADAEAVAKWLATQK